MSKRAMERLKKGQDRTAQHNRSMKEKSMHGVGNKGKGAFEVARQSAAAHARANTFLGQAMAAMTDAEESSVTHQEAERGSARGSVRNSLAGASSASGPVTSDESVLEKLVRLVEGQSRQMDILKLRMESLEISLRDKKERSLRHRTSADSDKAANRGSGTSTGSF